jgi:ribose transport system ATP-binding protein
MLARQDTVLRAENISKSFSGVQALSNVSLELKENEILGLVGENGAGKSTLVKILAGVYSKDTGGIFINGKKMTPKSVKEAEELGIGMISQEQSVLPNITVAENIFLGRMEKFTRFGVINWRKLNQEAKKQLEKIRCPVSPRAYTGHLEFGERQMVQIARILYLEEIVHGLIIILDETTSGLYQKDLDILFKIMREIKKRASIIFISHRLNEVLEMTDRIYVLKNGKNVSTLKTRVAEAEELFRLMVGRRLTSKYYREEQQVDYDNEIILNVKNLSKNSRYYNISFDLHKGEVLGLAGVQGSGREELCRTLFGIIKPDEGNIYIGGKKRMIKSPMHAITLGIGYLPVDRVEEGIILSLNVATNVTLPSTDSIIKNGLLDSKLERKITEKWIDKLRIVTPGINTLCLNLSGGNQQKVVLAKWLEAKIRVLVFVCPTRGLDIGSKEQIYDLIRQLASQGISIILIADSLEELIGLSNTIIVMKDGKIGRIFDAPSGRKPKQVDLIRYML